MASGRHRTCTRNHPVFYSLLTTRGFTLLELTIVVAIIAIIAVVALPHLASTDPARVELAAERVASALRFARSEAMRTDITHGVLIDHDNTEGSGKDIMVYQVDTSGSPFTVDHILYQPISKQPYDIFVPDPLEKLTISINSPTPVFQFDTVGNTQHVHFNGDGTPAYFQDSVPYRLINGIIPIGDGTTVRVVSLNIINGRVTIQ